MSTFTDFVQVQNFLAHGLLCDDALANVNVVTRDRLVENALEDPATQDQTLAAEVLVYAAEWNGKSGIGVVVEKPELVIPREFINAPGPQATMVVDFLVLENRMANEDPKTGTGLAADWVAQRILELAHQWAIEGIGVFSGDSNAVKEAKEWRPLRAYHTRLMALTNRAQSQRVGRVQWAFTDGQTGGTVTLTCDPGAQIYYSVTNPSGGQSGITPTFPGPSESAAVRYAAPFTPGPGLIVLAAGYAAGFINGPVSRRVMSS